VRHSNVLFTLQECFDPFADSVDAIHSKAFKKARKVMTSAKHWGGPVSKRIDQQFQWRISSAKEMFSNVVHHYVSHFLLCSLVFIEVATRAAVSCF